MRVALVVGHHSPSPGASNVSERLSEWEFNARLAVDIWRRFELLADEADDQRTSLIPEVVVVFRRTFATEVSDVNDVMRGRQGFVVAMHCNAYEEAPGQAEATGTEMLHYYKSARSRRLAELFQARFVGALGLPDRGVKGVTRDARGGKLLAETTHRAIICEPFFLDNDDDLGQATRVGLADVYVEAILDGVSELRKETRT